MVTQTTLPPPAATTPPDYLAALAIRGADTMAEFKLLLDYATTHSLRSAERFAAVLPEAA